MTSFYISCLISNDINKSSLHFYERDITVMSETNHKSKTKQSPGVAAANMGSGASTINSLFKLSADDMTADLDSEKLDELVTKLSKVRLLVIDEVSMVSAVQFEMISRRLDQVRKSRQRNGSGGAAPTTASGFGGISVLLVGDFGQLPPVSGSSLISRHAPRTGSTMSRSRTYAGQRRFHDFKNVIRLWRVYRQSAADHFKDSTMNLRDAVVSVADHELWNTHELNAQLLEPNWPGALTLLQDAVHLVVENARCGSINGIHVFYLTER